MLDLFSSGSSAITNEISIYKYKILLNSVSTVLFLAVLERMNVERLHALVKVPRIIMVYLFLRNLQEKNLQVSADSTMSSASVMFL